MQKCKPYAVFFCITTLLSRKCLMAWSPSWELNILAANQEILGVCGMQGFIITGTRATLQYTRSQMKQIYIDIPYFL